MIRLLATALMALGVAAGCQTTLDDVVMIEPEPEIVRAGVGGAAPPGAKPGTCWGKHIQPARLETVTEQAVVKPAETRADGTVVSPAAYQTETRQEIVQERQERWFETPCEEALTPEFVASVQRALQARGYYLKPITGVMDAGTRAAIRAYQKQDGLDAGALSMASAQKLGLMAVARPARQTPEAAPAAVTVAEVPAPQAPTEAEIAAAEKARQAAEAERAARARREAELQAALAEEQARSAREEAERKKAEAAERAAKAKREAELRQALEEEKARKAGVKRKLPISTESN